MESTIGGVDPRIGAAGAAAPSSGRAGDLSVVVPRARLQVAPAIGIAEADLGNVVPFLRRRPAAAAASAAPELVARPDQRPAPAGAHMPQWFAGALIAATAAHLALYFVFNREPPPMASIGQQSISVELVLGADQPAGLSPDQGPSAEEAPPPQQALDAPEESKPDEIKPTELAAVEPDKTPEQVEPPKETPPVRETTQTPPTDAPPVATLPPPPVAVETPTQAMPARVAAAPELAPAPPDVPTMRVAPLPKPTLAVPQAKPAPRKPPRHIAARGQPNDSRTTERAATASGGVGHGRSSTDSNYKGLVSAHLQRYKQTAERALSEGDRGRSAVITFSLDGGGRVRSALVSRSSGAASLDRAVLAMVHSASPFPAPPDGHGMNFTVPVHFNMR